MFIIIGLTARRGGEGKGKGRWRANTCVFKATSSPRLTGLFLSQRQGLLTRILIPNKTVTGRGQNHCAVRILTPYAPDIPRTVTSMGARLWRVYAHIQRPILLKTWSRFHPTTFVPKFQLGNHMVFSNKLYKKRSCGAEPGVFSNWLTFGSIPKGT